MTDYLETFPVLIECFIQFPVRKSAWSLEPMGTEIGFAHNGRLDTGVAQKVFQTRLHIFLSAVDQKGVHKSLPQRDSLFPMTGDTVSVKTPRTQKCHGRYCQQKKSSYQHSLFPISVFHSLSSFQRSVILVPLPFSDSIPISIPYCSTIRRTISSPRPNPPSLSSKRR